MVAGAVILVPLAAWSQKPIDEPHQPRPAAGQGAERAAPPRGETAAPADTGAHIMVTPRMLTWTEAPAILPPGAKIAVMEGRPSEPGLFTARLKLPAGYKIPPHWHPADEHLTVISGTFRVGLGDKYDEDALKDLPAGGFAVMARGTRHFAETKGETVVQIHAMGPWGLVYVNPADDPRQVMKK
jgi:quercetin dioxygenase-like cupin family protein